MGTIHAQTKPKQYMHQNFKKEQLKNQERWNQKKLKGKMHQQQSYQCPNILPRWSPTIITEFLQETTFQGLTIEEKHKKWVIQTHITDTTLIIVIAGSNGRGHDGQCGLGPLTPSTRSHGSTPATAKTKREWSLRIWSQDQKRMVFTNATPNLWLQTPSSLTSGTWLKARGRNEKIGYTSYKLELVTRA